MQNLLRLQVENYGDYLIIEMFYTYIEMFYKSLHQLSRKALLNQMESYKKADLIKLANQRNLHVNKKVATNKLKQLIITDINKEISQKELLNKYSDKINKIRKSYNYISNHHVSLHKSKLSDQLISSFKNRSQKYQKIHKQS